MGRGSQLFGLRLNSNAIPARARLSVLVSILQSLDDGQIGYLLSWRNREDWELNPPVKNWGFLFVKKFSFYDYDLKFICVYITELYFLEE